MYYVEFIRFAKFARLTAGGKIKRAQISPKPHRIDKNILQ